MNICNSKLEYSLYDQQHIIIIDDLSEDNYRQGQTIQQQMKEIEDLHQTNFNLEQVLSQHRKEICD